MLHIQRRYVVLYKILSSLTSLVTFGALLGSAFFKSAILFIFLAFIVRLAISPLVECTCCPCCRAGGRSRDTNENFTYYRAIKVSKDKFECPYCSSTIYLIPPKHDDF